jgi:hypothetical protein
MKRFSLSRCRLPVFFPSSIFDTPMVNVREWIKTKKWRSYHPCTWPKKYRLKKGKDAHYYYERGVVGGPDGRQLWMRRGILDYVSSPPAKEDSVDAQGKRVYTTDEAVENFGVNKYMVNHEVRKGHLVPRGFVLRARPKGGFEPRAVFREADFDSLKPGYSPPRTFSGFAAEQVKDDYLSPAQIKEAAGIPYSFLRECREDGRISIRTSNYRTGGRWHKYSLSQAKDLWAKVRAGDGYTLADLLRTFNDERGGRLLGRRIYTFARRGTTHPALGRAMGETNNRVDNRDCKGVVKADADAVAKWEHDRAGQPIDETGRIWSKLGDRFIGPGGIVCRRLGWTKPGHDEAPIVLLVQYQNGWQRTGCTVWGPRDKLLALGLALESAKKGKKGVSSLAIVQKAAARVTTTASTERKLPAKAKHLKWQQWHEEGLSYNQIVQKEFDEGRAKPTRDAVAKAIKRLRQRPK